jgi:serine/threonine protein kinase
VLLASVGKGIKVYEDVRAKERISGKIFCGDRQRTEEIFFKEIETLAKLRHPCILSFKGYCLPNAQQETTIYTEFLEEGSLDKVVEKRPGWWYASDMVMAVAGIILGMEYSKYRKNIRVQHVSL